MAGRPESISPKAAACMAHGWGFADHFPIHRCLAYTGFMSGLTLGMALAHIDPGWAGEAYEELVRHQAALWGNDGMPPEAKRLATWKEAQHLISAAPARPRRDEKTE